MNTFKEDNINAQYEEMCEDIKSKAPSERAFERFRFFVQNTRDIEKYDDLPACQKTNLEALSNLKHMDGTRPFFEKINVGSFIDTFGHHYRLQQKIFNAYVMQ